MPWLSTWRAVCQEFLEIVAKNVTGDDTDRRGGSRAELTRQVPVNLHGYDSASDSRQW